MNKRLFPISMQCNIILASWQIVKDAMACNLKLALNNSTNLLSEVAHGRISGVPACWNSKCWAY